jgi:hypothetical protein
VAEYSVGSIWSVLGVEDGRVVVLAGPFAASRGSPEYLVAPLYSGAEPGFAWSSEDVLLNPNETGLGVQLYAAVWNARPVLEVDLLFRLGQLQDDATVAVRDAYWASLNERPLGKSPRLGPPVRSIRDPAAQFQAGELERWQPVSGRALQHSQDLSASATFLMGETWSLTPEDVACLEKNIERSEVLLLPLELSSVGPGTVSFKATLTSLCIGSAVPEQSLFNFLTARPLVGYQVSEAIVASVKVQTTRDVSEELEAVEANSELALAA